MVFSSLVFVAVFFPLVLILYHLSKNITYKNIILVVSSLVFYAWGEPVWVLALLFSGTLDYVVGRVIGAHPGRWQAKAGLLCSLIINLGILVVFKYSGFLVENINALFNLSLPIPTFTMPLGISFYTFQTLTYSIDMYRGDCKMQKSWLCYMTYLTMFPQLVAGPIVRYVDVAEQVGGRTVTAEQFASGITRFVSGMGKKVILANSAGALATLILDSGDLSIMPMWSAWLGILAYTFQIYFDFSGYSDMAIGMGRMFGFHFPENFNYPYIAKNATEFWRRWHISLSSFFRDYIYIPLGGNRYREVRNLLIVWFLTGFWHGASWNFIFWGLFYGVILILEKKLFKGAIQRMPRPFCWIYTMFIVMFGWALFYFTDLSQLGLFLRSAFGQTGTMYDVTTITALSSNIWLLIACLIGSTPVPRMLYHGIVRRKGAVATVLPPVAVIVGFAICFVLLVGQTYNPFLYFRF